MPLSLIFTALKILLPILIIGGGIWYVNDNAYNRGDAAGAARVTAQMTAAIKKQADAVKRDMDRLKQLSPAELDKKLEELCRQAGGGDACAP